MLTSSPLHWSMCDWRFAVIFFYFLAVSKGVWGTARAYRCSSEFVYSHCFSAPVTTRYCWIASDSINNSHHIHLHFLIQCISYFQGDSGERGAPGEKVWYQLSVTVPTELTRVVFISNKMKGFLVSGAACKSLCSVFQGTRVPLGWRPCKISRA